MAIRLDIKGHVDLIKIIKEYGFSTNKKVREAVSATALSVQSDAIKSIQRGSKTGITYKKYKPNRMHRASAPGEAPASDTGRLAGSIEAVEFTPLAWEVGTLLNYGEWLEFGTQNIAERPWLRPALQRNKAEFFNRLREALKR